MGLEQGQPQEHSVPEASLVNTFIQPENRGTEVSWASELLGRGVLPDTNPLSV